MAETTVVNSVVKDIQRIYVQGEDGRRLGWKDFCETVRNYCLEKRLDQAETAKVLAAFLIS
jgi:hypothetical protein